MMCAVRSIPVLRIQILLYLLIKNGYFDDLKLLKW